MLPNKRFSRQCGDEGVIFLTAEGSNEMDQSEREQFCTFFRGSHYDIIQARNGDTWGPVFTFVACDACAARQSIRMLRLMQHGETMQVRHARRACLRNLYRQTDSNIVVVTTIPDRLQEVFGLEDGCIIRVNVYLQEDALAAIEAEVAQLNQGMPVVNL